MKRLIYILAVCMLIAAGCKGGSQSAAKDPESTAEVDTKAVAGEEFSFDELFGIFSIFGDNIMTEKFAPQSVKDGIKDALRASFESAVEFLGPCNWLSYDLSDGNGYNGFQMACYRYKADDHVLVMLLENGGADVSSVKYIRAYEYDPAQKSAHEVQLPFNPMPERNDFEDMVRLAGADVPALRAAMQAGSYDYSFRPDGVRVRLNDPMDFDEQVYHGDLVVDYLWNGSELVRNGDYRYTCIHPDGFANIILGEPAPDFHFDYDPKGYRVEYSQGGDLWLINLGEEETLQVQMENGKVYSIETRSPRFNVASYAYESGDGKEQPHVGACINDCITLGAEVPEVRMLMDGTVQIEVDAWNSKLAFRTSPHSLVKHVEASPNGPIRIENPSFKPDAKIESILLWRD